MILSESAGWSKDRLEEEYTDFQNMADVQYRAMMKIRRV